MGSGTVIPSATQHGKQLHLAGELHLPQEDQLLLCCKERLLNIQDGQPENFRAVSVCFAHTNTSDILKS